MKKDKHIGRIFTSNMGFALRVTKWESRDRILVEVVETGEEIWTDYWSLQRGETEPDILKYPPHGECSIAQALFFTIAIILLIAGFLTCFIKHLVSL